MKLSSKQPYDILDDGTIRIHEDQYEELKSMFRRGGFDIDELTTPETFEEAFSRTGDALFEKMIEDVRSGDTQALKVLEAIAEGNFTEAKAQCARATFEVISGEQESPLRSS